MLLATFGVAVWFGYRERMRNVVDKKVLVRQMISTELIRRHWEITAEKSMGGILGGIADELNQSHQTVNVEVLRASPEVMFMHAKERGQLNQVEQDAISRLDSGEREVWDVKWNGDVHYIGVLKNSKKCSVCHSKPDGAPGGDLGVIRVDIQQK
jgi:hypothetical protein